MAILDVLIIFGYMALLICIGVWVSRSVKTNEDAVVAGKSFGAFSAAVGKTANLAGGPTVVGGAGYGYSYGFGGSWFLLSSMVTSWISAPFAPRIWKAMHRGHLVSIGGYIGHRFGKFSHVFAGITNGLAYTGFVAAQIVATGTLINVLLGWDLNVAMIFSTVVVMGYTILGGLKAVIYNDWVQMTIMIVGFFFILMPVTITKAGGWNAMLDTVPAAYLQWGNMGWLHIIGSIILPTALAGFTMQATYAYIGAAKDVKASWTSSILAGFLYLIIAAGVLLVGMATFTLVPGINDQQALATAILKFLPHGLIGLLLAAVLSATMSTAASCSISAATNINNDVIEPLFGKAPTEKALLRTRILIVCVTLVALGFAVLYPQIIGLLLLGYAFGAGGLLVPVLATMFWKRATSPGVIASMLGGGISYVVLSKLVTWPPLFVSIPVSLVLLVVISLMTPAQDPRQYAIYFDEEWNKHYPDREVL